MYQRVQYSKGEELRDIMGKKKPKPREYNENVTCKTTGLNGKPKKLTKMKRSMLEKYSY